MLSMDKKILLSLPSETAQELSLIAEESGCSRSKVLRDAVTSYIREYRKKALEQQLKQGYLAMGEINLEWEDACFSADSTTQFCYEEKLSECEECDCKTW